MGYYQAQLAELIQYPDMRTEVFQLFREVGNAILFCMLVEQALVSDSQFYLFSIQAGYSMIYVWHCVVFFSPMFNIYCMTLSSGVCT